MRRIKQVRLSPALVVAVVALVAALGGGAVAGVAVNALNQKQIKEVREIAKKQDRKQLGKVRRIARNRARQAVDGLESGPKGDRGPEGPPGVRGAEGDTGAQGPPGPSTGPAGGDLAGDYPDPTIADEAVSASAVATDSLGGDQIDELSLVGFDRSSSSGAFIHNVGAPTSLPVGSDLVLRSYCTGLPGNIGYEIQIENNSGSPFAPTIYANAITDDAVAQATRTSIADGFSETILDIPRSTTTNLVHWLTIHVPGQKLTEEWILRTKYNGNDRCAADRYRTVTSG